MLKSSLLGSTLLFLLCGTGAVAQPYPGDLIVSLEDATLVRVDPTGAITTIGVYYAPDAPNMLSIDFDSDNRQVIAAVANLTSAPFTGRLLRIDLASGLATTVANTPAPWPLCLDENGDYLIGGSRRRYLAFDLLRVAPDGSRVTTVRTALRHNFKTIGRDVTTGEWLVDTAPGNLTRFSADWTSVLGTLAYNQLRLHALDGDWTRARVYAAVSNGLMVFDLRQRTRTLIASLYNTLIFIDGDVAVDRDLRPGNGVIVISAVVPFRIERFDDDGTNVGTFGGFSAHITGIRFDRSRNIGLGVVAPPNDRAIHVNIPEDAGKWCICAVGISGCAPGMPLADGRVLPWNPDSVLQLSAGGALAPLLTNNIARLNRRGSLVARLDLNPLGAAARGLAVWVAAVTLDPNAPLGIATITKPAIIVH